MSFKKNESRIHMGGEESAFIFPSLEYFPRSSPAPHSPANGTTAFCQSSVLTSTFPDNEPTCLGDSGHRKHLLSYSEKHVIPEPLPTLGSSLVLSPRRQAPLLPSLSLSNAYADEMTQCSHACSGWHLSLSLIILYIRRRDRSHTGCLL